MDTLGKLVLIVEAMQLPVVALIFFFTYNSAISDEIKEESFVIWRKIKGKINKENPLIFIALGFSLNFLYLIFNLIDLMVNRDPNGHIVSNYPLDFWIFITRVLTTCFFLLQVILQLYISNNESNVANNLDSTKRKLFSWTVFTYSIVIFIAILFTTAILIVNSYNPQEFYQQILEYSLQLFEIFGHIVVSVYLYNLFSKDNNSLSNDFTRNFLITGWIIWTALQFWTAIGEAIFSKDSLWVAFIGFSLSLLAKLLILFGLYYFSVVTSRNATERLDNVNRTLTEVNIKLEEANKQQKGKNIQLEKTQNLINLISNSTSLDELAGKVVTHLTNKDVFDFDYAIFSEVNYLEQKIIYKDSKTENKRIEDADKWVRKEGFPFNHHDIMAQVYNHRKIIHARGELVDDEPIDITSDKSSLNFEVYSKYNHRNLNRFYIPVLDLMNIDEDDNKVFAIIEVGYNIRDIDNDKDKHKTKKIIEKLGELNLYIGSCAQSYNRLLNQDVENKTDWLLERCNGLSRDNHRLYLQEILKSTCELVNAEYCFIALFPTSKVSHTPDIIFAEDKINGKEKEHIEKTFNDCLEVNTDSDSHIEINESEFENKIHKLLNTNSLQINKINVHESSFGYLFMFGKNEGFLNDVVKSILTKISEKIYSTYNEKKFHNAVSSLITPDNAITDLEINLQPLIEALKDYFETPYISIWLRENKDNKEYYIQKYASNELKAACETFNNKILIDNINLEDDYNPIKLNSSDNDVNNSLFKGFGYRNNVKTLLRKPLKTQHQFFGFIHIYSNKNIDDLDHEDKKENKEFLNYEDKNFLDLITIKALITIQIHKLVKAFSDISASFTQNDLKETLKTITDSAVDLLDADPVILFKSNNGVDVFCNNVMFSGKADFKEKGIIKLFEIEKDSHVEFAEQIIKDRSKYFKNKSEYQDYILEHPKIHNKRHFEKDFWDREGIQSLAVVRLIHRTKNYEKPVGVMFINFRKKVNLDDVEIKGLIRTFADFAATAIHNAYLIEQNIAFLEMRRKDEFAMSIGEIATAHAHDSAQLLASMSFCFMSFLDSLEKKYKSSELIPKKIVEDKLLAPIKLPLEELTADFMRLENYRGFATFNAKPNKMIPLVNETITLLRYRIDKNSIDVEVKSMRDDATVYCDSNQILHLLMNIFINAIDAIGKKGSISVGTNITDKKDFLILRITDTGIGIPNENRDKIFKPFFTTKQNKGGTGVGLPICKYIIEKHDGSIEFEKNAVGKGTSFLIKFPIMKGEKND